MKILKELRKYHKYTQADLAKQLKVSQQTIAKWESGKTEPTLANLRDLALCLSTSVDELLGEDKTPKTMVNHTPSYFGDNPHGFWGHIGIGVPNKDKSLWYPITLHDANRLTNALYDSFSPFMSVDTLNGRTLYFNKNNISYLHFLPDSADQIENDWELGWDGYQGYPADIYPALADYLLNGELNPDDYSDDFIKLVENIASEHKNLEFKDIEYSHVYTLNKHSHHYIDINELSDITNLELFEKPEWVNIGDSSHGFDMFVLSDKIILLDVPLHLSKQAIKSIFSDSFDEIIK